MLPLELYGRIGFGMTPGRAAAALEFLSFGPHPRLNSFGATDEQIAELRPHFIESHGWVTAP